MIPYLDLHCDTLELGFLKKKEDIYEETAGFRIGAHDDYMGA